MASSEWWRRSQRSQQQASATGGSRITQVAGNHVSYEYEYAPGAGPAPKALLGLPEAPAELVGRDGLVQELLERLAEGDEHVVVAGLAGVGKTALALTAAHRAAEQGWFGDRVFFLAMSGYAPGWSVSGSQAVQEILRQFGIRDSDMPSSPAGRLALYRAELAALARAGQRVLIIADSAGSVDQVLDLVPPQNTHRLLVTSRHRLMGMGFVPRLFLLDELAPRPAAELLAGILLRTRPEDPRPAAEPEALAQIAQWCHTNG